MLYVLFLNLSFKLPHTASILSPAEKIWFRNALNELPLHCQPEVVFHIEGDSHVGGLPLYVELVTRFQADQEYVYECFRTLFFLQMATCKEGRRPGETKAAKPEREAVLVAAEH